MTIPERNAAEPRRAAAVAAALPLNYDRSNGGDRLGRSARAA